MWNILFIRITILICQSKSQFELDCDSSKPTDIIFGIDASGSLKVEGFEKEKEFVKEVSLSRLSNNTRMGYTLFSTTVDVAGPLQFWDESTLSQFIDALPYASQYTNTPALIESAIWQFNVSSEPGTDRRLMIITDGYPQLPSGIVSVCQYATQLQSAGIKTTVIGFEGFVTDKVDCIADYFIPSELVSNSDLSQILCTSPNSINYVNTTGTYYTMKYSFYDHDHVDIFRSYNNFNRCMV